MLDGVIIENSIIKLPDGKLLKVIELKRWCSKVPRVEAPKSVGVMVEGIGWKLNERDMLKYRGEIVEIYSDIGQDRLNENIENH